ncbi:GL23609 [Drosophila persimilis]|uniref:Serine palmitoyltransferase small subunit B n=1 Tax=Drosophila persimilis TaxID=7234 RepID=B4G2H0_DROPE|nr:serine palmitoyltransferase small subunit B [Drosophila persimilis]EDW24015.1 GL23609 [Drosophila persimilis]
MFNIKQLATHLYRQYELITCINMLEPWERKLINGFFLVVLALVFFSSCWYLPNYMQTLMEFISPLAWSSQSGNAAYVAQKMGTS